MVSGVSMKKLSGHGLIYGLLLASLALHAGVAWYWYDDFQPQTSLPDNAADEFVVRLVSNAVPMQKVAEAEEPREPVSREPVKSSTPVTTYPDPPEKHEVLAAVASTTGREPLSTSSMPHEKSAAITSTLAQRVEPKPPDIPDLDVQSLRESYLLRLMQHIEQHKFYPAAARRKRLEGDVTVEMKIACDGGLQSSALQGTQVVLKRAAARALFDAQPLPVPDSGLPCPLELGYVMVYHLR